MAVTDQDNARSAVGPKDVSQQIINYVSGYSIEVTPRVAGKVQNFAELLPKGTDVYVTLIPGADYKEVVEACVTMAKWGYNPVPHIPARSIATHHDLEDYIARASQEAGVSQVLCIGGGVDTPVGEYHETMQVLRSGYLEKYGIKRVGVAGHPEGNRDIGEAGVRRSLQQKNEFARAHPELAFYIVTQFLFDSEVVKTWDRIIREQGNILPVHLGIPGPANIKTLINYARLSGVGPSMRVLTRNAGGLMKVAGMSAPDGLITNVAHYAATETGTCIKGAHFYPFGGMTRTCTWVRQVVNGEFTMKRDKSGFEVQHPIG